MRCSEVQQKLDLFAARELAPPVRAMIEGHLESCAACRGALVRLRRLESLLAGPAAPPVPSGFAARVVARAKERQAAGGRPLRRPHRRAQLAWRSIRVAAGTAAALAAGLMLGLLMGHQTWQSGHLTLPTSTSQRANPLTASGFDYLVEPGGNSLAQAYVGLITASDR